MMLISRTSLITGKSNTMELPLTEEMITAWEISDLKIQDAFPFLTATEREFLLSGATPEEWNEFFSEEQLDNLS